jgi:hypothetical protein
MVRLVIRNILFKNQILLCQQVLYYTAVTYNCKMISYGDNKLCAFRNCKGFVMAATYAHKVYIALTFNGQFYMHFIDVTYNVRMITYAIFGSNFH